MKTRIIQTRFWDDEFVTEAYKLTKYVYLYLLTCPYINICGIFQLSEKKIMFETGITLKEFERAKSELKAAHKVFFYKGWIFVINARKNNNYERSEKNKIACTTEISRIPQTVKSFFDKVGDSTIHSSINTTIDSTHKPKTINHKSKIRNHKSETKNQKPKKKNFTKKVFKKNWKELLKKAETEHSHKSDYKHKDFDKVMQEFLEGIEIKDYKYKNYYLAFLRWVRNSKHTIHQKNVIGGKTKLAIS